MFLVLMCFCPLRVVTTRLPCSHKRECTGCSPARIASTGGSATSARTAAAKASAGHGRQRNTCKECGGSGICEHGRRRSVCKECGGGGICEHGRVRNICKECGGSSICEHGRRRDRCKECGGSDHVIILEATAVERDFDDDGEEPDEGIAAVQAHVVAGPRGGKRKR